MTPRMIVSDLNDLDIKVNPFDFHSSLVPMDSAGCFQFTAPTPRGRGVHQIEACNSSCPPSPCRDTFRCIKAHLDPSLVHITRISRKCDWRASLPIVVCEMYSPRITVKALRTAYARRPDGLLSTDTYCYVD
jgi:hypothetical protein